MQFTLKQKILIRDANARLNISEGSVRSGKSVGTDIKFLMQVPKTSRKGDIFLIGKTLGALKRNVINPLLSYIGKDGRYYPGKQEFHLWGRICYCIGANDASSENKIRGSTAALAYGDEVTLWPESFFTQLDARLSLEDSLFLGTTNPDHPKHWLKTNYLDRRDDLDLNVFHFNLTDNTFLSPKYIENIKKNYTGLWYKRFILGTWCAAEGAIYDFFDEDEHTYKGDIHSDSYVVSIDYGTTNPCCFLLWGFKNRKAYLVDEYYYDSKASYRQKTDREYAIDLLKFLSKYTRQYDKKIKSLLPENTVADFLDGKRKSASINNIIIDPSASSFKAELRNHGLIGVVDADNEVLDGLRLTSSKIKNREILINTRCKNTIDEFSSYMWDEKAKLRGEDKPLKENDHCMDAMRYFVYTMYRKGIVDLQKLTRM